MRNRSWLLLSFVVLGGCVQFDGCEQTTEGERQRSQFSYRSEGCAVFGCEIVQPMMLGTSEAVQIRSTRRRALDTAVVAADPTVFGVEDVSVSVDCCSDDACVRVPADACDARVANVFHDLTLTATAPGQTHLALRRPDGNDFDRLLFTVEAARDLVVVSADGPTLDDGDLLLVSPGTFEQLSVQAIGSSGVALRATSGFTWTLEDPSLGTIREAGPGSPGAIELRPAGDGETSLVLTGGGVTRTFRVRFATTG